MRLRFQIIYKSFKALDMQKFIFSPFFLKEFRNRWFVYGWKKGDGMLYNLALNHINNFSHVYAYMRPGKAS